MSTTTNIITGVTLTSALVVGGLVLAPETSDPAIVDDGGVVEGPKVGAFFLRFPDEGTWMAAVKASPFWVWEQAMVDAGPDAGMVPVQLDAGSVSMAGSGHAIDIVGTIELSIDGGDGGTETLPGWHVNFQGVLPDEWAQYIVEPQNPVRVWAR